MSFHKAGLAISRLRTSSFWYFAMTKGSNPPKYHNAVIIEDTSRRILEGWVEKWTSLRSDINTAVSARNRNPPVPS
jgi:hypothetical protein